MSLFLVRVGSLIPRLAFLGYLSCCSLPECSRKADSLPTRLAFFTRRAVEAGEELTFDYGGHTSPGECAAPADDAKSRIECQCGSTICRGFLPFDPRLV